MCDGFKCCYKKLWVLEVQLGGSVEEEPIVGMYGPMSPGREKPEEGWSSGSGLGSVLRCWAVLFFHGHPCCHGSCLDLWSDPTGLFLYFHYDFFP